MFLITFPSMTDAFAADKSLGEQWPHKVVPVPPKLSETCYGVGVRLSVPREALSKIKAHLDDQNLRYKYFWNEETCEKENV